MIRTKQITVVCASVALLCILCAQAFATRSASPIMQRTRMKTCPFTTMVTFSADLPTMRMESIAQAGYIRYWRYDLWAILSMTQVDSILPLWNRPDRFSPTDQESHLYGFNYSESA